METKHTLAPWVADGSETTMATWVNGSDGKRICSMRKCNHDWSNAKLIAAAPELLEALKDLVARIDEYGSPISASFARAAIAKATGQ